MPATGGRLEILKGSQTWSVRRYLPSFSGWPSERMMGMRRFSQEESTKICLWSLQVHEDAGKLCLVYLIRAGEIPATGGRLKILKGSLTWSGRRHFTLFLNGMLLGR